MLAWLKCVGERDLQGAVLRKADLHKAVLREVRLAEADLTGARLFQTILKGATGLETVCADWIEVGERSDPQRLEGEAARQWLLEAAATLTDLG